MIPDLVNQRRSAFSLSSILNKLIIVISIGIVGHLIFLLSTTDREILVQTSQLSFPYVISICGLLMIPWLGHSIRLVLWTSFLKQPLRFSSAFKIAVTTDLGSAVTPTLIGGGPIKLGLLLAKGYSAAKASTLILLNAVEDLSFYIIGLVLCFWIAQDSMSIFIYGITDFIWKQRWVLISLVILLVTGSLILKKQGRSLSDFFIDMLPYRLQLKLRNIYIKISESVSELQSIIKFIFKKGKLTFSLSLLILITQWFSKFSVLLILLLALDIDFTWYLIYIKQWLVWLTMIIVPTPGASGGAEAAFYLIFEDSISNDILNLVTSIWRFFTYYYVLFTALAFFQLFSLLDKRKIIT